jgi:uncharacterized phage-associated protein
MDYKKVTEAAALLLSLGGVTEKLKLVKLLYLVDRDFLIEHGVPIFYDNHVAMKHGPALSLTLNLMNGNCPDAESNAFWKKHIAGPSGPQYSMSLQEALEPEHLSSFEIDMIKKVHGRHRATGVWELRDQTHTSGLCPEWSDPGNSSIAISISEILKKWGKSADEAASAERYVASLRGMLRQAHG